MKPMGGENDEEGNKNPTKLLTFHDDKDRFDDPDRGDVEIDSELLGTWGSAISASSGIEARQPPPTGSKEPNKNKPVRWSVLYISDARNFGDTLSHRSHCITHMDLVTLA